MEAVEPQLYGQQIAQLTCHVFQLHSIVSSQQDQLASIHRRLESLDTEIHQLQRHLRQLCRSCRREFVLGDRVADRVGALEERERVAESYFQAFEERLRRLDSTYQALDMHICQLRDSVLEFQSRP